MGNRRDHKAVKKMLLKMGYSKNERKAFHELVTARHHGLDATDYQKEDRILFKAGFDSWDIIPMEYRRNWQEQPD